MTRDELRSELVMVMTRAMMAGHTDEAIAIGAVLARFYGREDLDGIQVPPRPEHVPAPRRQQKTDFPQ